jgi:hypothetical protein
MFSTWNSVSNSNYAIFGLKLTHEALEEEWEKYFEGNGKDNICILFLPIEIEHVNILIVASTLGKLPLQINKLNSNFKNTFSFRSQYRSYTSIESNSNNLNCWLNIFSEFSPSYEI